MNKIDVEKSSWGGIPEEKLDDETLEVGKTEILKVGEKLAEGENQVVNPEPIPGRVDPVGGSAFDSVGTEPDELQFVDSDIQDAFVGKGYPTGTPTQVQLSRVGKAFMEKMDQLGFLSRPERAELEGLRRLHRAVTGTIGPNAVPLQSEHFYSWAQELPQSKSAPQPESAIVQWLIRVGKALESLGG